MALIVGAIVMYLLFIKPAMASENLDWCYVEQVTPTITPTPTEVTPTPVDEITPTPTEVPTYSQGGYSTPDSGGPPPVCIGTEIKYAPTITEVKRIDADSVWIKWTPVDQHIKTYVIQYGLGSVPMWNTKVTGLSTDLNYLPNWLPIWARVAGTDECVVGPYGEWVDP